MTITMDNFPCTGKNMGKLAIPWLLVTLYDHDGMHGYEITINKHNIEAMGVCLNMTGLSRHRNMMEKR